MIFSEKYEPLYDLLLVEEALAAGGGEQGIEYWEALEKVDKVFVTGGRGSAKSKAVADFVCDATVINGWKTLYTRYTKESMNDSVIAELEQAFEDVGYNHLIRPVGNKIYSRCGDGLISFKGIKPGSGNQTANLKSLKGFNLHVTEEAEEIPNYEIDKKIFYSIRSVDHRNISIKILNPQTTDHWIYEEFFEKRGVEGGSNCIKGDTMYIHTSYLDVPKQYIATNIRADYERLKIEDPEEYDAIVMGGWSISPRGALFHKNELQYFAMKDLKQDQVESVVGYTDIADEGTDHLAFAIGKMVGKLVFITDVVFTQDNTDITLPQVAFIAKEEKAEYVQCESNSQGAKFARDLQNELKRCQVIPIFNKANKNTRIIAQYGFIKRYMRFRNDYEVGSDYHKFMKQLYGWMKDLKNQPDDAPDCISGLSNFINKTYASLYQ